MQRKKIISSSVYFLFKGEKKTLLRLKGARSYFKKAKLVSFFSVRFCVQSKRFRDQGAKCTILDEEQGCSVILELWLQLLINRQAPVSSGDKSILPSQDPREVGSSQPIEHKHA